MLVNKKMVLWTIPFMLLLVTGCGSKNNDLPLPSSVKTISSNTIQVPFPYSESSNGEQWNFSRDASNRNPVVQVKNGGNIVATFRVNVSSNPSFTLGGQKYTVESIRVNSDNESGVVTLVKQ